MTNSIFVKKDGDFVLGEDDIVSKKDVMDELQISRSTMQRYMNKGLPFTLFENKAGFIWTQVNGWLMENGHEHIYTVAKMKRRRKALLEQYSDSKKEN